MNALLHRPGRTLGALLILISAAPTARAQALVSNGGFEAGFASSPAIFFLAPAGEGDKERLLTMRQLSCLARYVVSTQPQSGQSAIDAGVLHMRSPVKSIELGECWLHLASRVATCQAGALLEDITC